MICFLKRIYYFLRAKYQRISYRIKYGIDIDEAMKEYGRNVIITEKKED